MNDPGQKRNDELRIATGLTLRRGEESVQTKSTETFTWPPAAMQEFEDAKNDLVDALRRRADVLTRARRSTIVTDAEVRDALRHIVIGYRRTGWIRICRIAAVLAVLGGGAALSHGLENGDALLTALGVGFALVLTALQELLLHYER